jgi:PelA/Pel-15E family pectate lyase
MGFKNIRFIFFAFSVFFSALAAQTAAGQKNTITVAADGSGDVKTVGEAIDKVPENNKRRFTIRIKPGVYREQILIPAGKPFISIVGENAATTVLTFKLSSKEAGSTSGSFAFYVAGHDFYAENVTFENSFGTGAQAVAVLSEADRAVFRSCRFLGWQDTLYAKRGRQFFVDCYIEGSVDFIFGQAAAVFEKCTVHSKTDGYVAAPMRFAADEPSGYVFIDSKLTAEASVKGVYLARPWRAFGRTVYLNTEMGAHIRPEGWHNWGKTENEKTAYFAEYNSKGPGAAAAGRVTWMHRLTKEEARNFEPENFLKGKDGWNPAKPDAKWQEATPPDFKPVTWREVLKQAPLWYQTDEAARIADQVVLYQKANGGWEKNIDMASMLTQRARAMIAENLTKGETTIDNEATYKQVAYLAKIVTAGLAKTTPPANLPKYREAFFKGLDFLFAAQYESGGFPQFFPLKKGYYTHITFNDDAMIGVLKVFRDVAGKKEDYLFVDDERRLKAEAALAKAIPLIIKLQVVVGGKKTVWAAQYDETKLTPANARAFEPASLTGGESVDVVRFLMSVKNPDAATIEAVEAAVEWYRKNKLEGVRMERRQTPEGWKYALVKDRSAPPLWGRFYQIETMKPIFVGRDAVIKYDISELDPERAGGYTWFVETPQKLISEEYPKWVKKLEKSKTK